MTEITITCPITWYARLEWIRKNCYYIDETNWSMWQMGMNSIYIFLTNEDATWYHLVWD